MTNETGYGVLTDAQWDATGPTDRAVPPAPQDRARQPPPHHRGDHLAAREWREMAQHPAPSGAVVDGGADLHPLEPPWRMGASVGTGATARRDQAGDGVPRRHHDPGPSESRWSDKEGR